MSSWTHRALAGRSFWSSVSAATSLLERCRAGRGATGRRPAPPRDAESSTPAELARGASSRSSLVAESSCELEREHDRRPRRPRARAPRGARRRSVRMPSLRSSWASQVRRPSMRSCGSRCGSVAGCSAASAGCGLLAGRRVARSGWVGGFHGGAEPRPSGRRAGGSATAPSSGSSGEPRLGPGAIPPAMLWASQPASRKACAAIAGAVSAAAVEDDGPVLAGSSPRARSARSSSMWRAPAMCPASHS